MTHAASAAFEGSPLRRPLFALPLLLASALVLAGCAAEPAESDGDTSSTPQTPLADIDVCATPGGDVVDSLGVTGDFGTQPVLDFATPVAAVDETEVAVAIDGGTSVAPGANVRAAFMMINGSTGEVLQAFGYAEGEPGFEFRADLEVLRPGFAKALGCVGPGSRIVAVIPPDEGLGEEAALGDDDMLVFIADVLADLSPAEWVTDLPEIGGTDDAPTVTLPNVAPKTDLELAVLSDGDGDVVGVNDTVTVHYLGTAWETGEVFDQSYARGAPSTFQVQGVVAGFREALIGQKVGSRVLVTMPPELGYGASPGHKLETSTLVFLIDIVAIAG